MLQSRGVTPNRADALGLPDCSLADLRVSVIVQKSIGYPMKAVCDASGDGLLSSDSHDPAPPVTVEGGHRAAPGPAASPRHQRL